HAFPLTGVHCTIAAVRCPLLTRCRVPASLEEVTAVGAETPPRELGVSPEAVVRIWAAVERLYASGLHPAIQLSVRRHGQVLIDRAGLPNPPPEAMDLDRLDDPEGIVRILCEMKLTGRPGRQLAYHAVTGGFILGEVVRRVTGKTIRTVLDEEVRRPLGFRWLSYGVPPADVGQVAVNYFTGPPPLPPLSTILGRALGVEFRRAIAMANDPRFLT